MQVSKLRQGLRAFLLHTWRVFSMSKLTCLGLIALAIAMFIVGWNQASLSSNTNSNSVVKVDHNLEIQNLEVELRILKTEELDLLAKKNSLVKVVQETSVANTSSVAPLGADLKNYPTLEESLAGIDRIKAHYKNNPEFDMDAERDKIFMAQPVDKVWAEAREERLHKMFKTNSQLQGKAIKAIECRSKHCRIEIFYQDLAETGVIAQYVYKLVGEKQYSDLFVGGGDMKISHKDKVLGIYVSSDPKASFF